MKSGWGHGVITISGYADTPLQLLEAMAPHRIKIFCTKRLLETRQKLNPENFVWRGLVSKNEQTISLAAFKSMTSCRPGIHNIHNISLFVRIVEVTRYKLWLYTVG